MTENNKRIEIYDTTLRDGTQAEGVSLALQDKLLIVRALDELGIDYIEGGYPLSNPKDAAFFAEASKFELKNAKLTDETIELVMREKVVETCAFTVEEILALKKAGLSDKTIQMLITEHSFMKASEPILYGKDIRSIKFTTASDLIELKNAGLSE